MTDLGLPKAEHPKYFGLSSDRLERISAVFRRDVDRGLIPGAVVADRPQREDRVCGGAGWRDREKRSPMALDAIFRIASMTNR
jgi:CubicO group peptidase (beta-lactamase class C family)